MKLIEVGQVRWKVASVSVAVLLGFVREVTFGDGCVVEHFFVFKVLCNLCCLQELSVTSCVSCVQVL